MAPALSQISNWKAHLLVSFDKQKLVCKMTYPHSSQQQSIHICFWCRIYDGPRGSFARLHLRFSSFDAIQLFHIVCLLVTLSSVIYHLYFRFVNIQNTRFLSAVRRQRFLLRKRKHTQMRMKMLLIKRMTSFFSTFDRPEGRKWLFFAKSGLCFNWRISLYRDFYQGGITSYFENQTDSITKRCADKLIASFRLLFRLFFVFRSNW